MVFSMVHVFSLLYEDEFHKYRVYFHVKGKMHVFETLYIFS